MYAYKSNCDFRAIDVSFVLDADEVSFDHLATDAELEIAFPGFIERKKAVASQAARASVTVARLAAYRNESDPLYMKYQAKEATEVEWLTKRAEIKVRYPYPAA